MSASLVGSEMCIRDRSSVELTSLGCATSGVRLRNFRAWPQKFPSARVRNCLLYTSDAADDM
eukprot:8579164-Alexandrium_andersonii.AAC.1